VHGPKGAPELTWVQRDRFAELATVERIFSSLKDEFLGSLRVRGPAKVMAIAASRWWRSRWIS
jgi:hypothetical protein